MRKSCESVGEWRDAICAAAAKRESVVWWTIWWARSSKTVDWEGCQYMYTVVRGGIRTLTRR